MKALVIYDSVFGNTGQIALATGGALGTPDETGIIQVSKLSAEPWKGMDLLVVGSPTRGFRPTDALAEFLKSLPPESLNGIRVAAFDTRLAVEDIDSSAVRFIVKTGGYAAKPIAERLKKAGGDLIVPPEGFFVQDTEGPLKEGELQRAADWAKSILAAG